ncbi:hypothetical protein FQA39_LY02727 [Lamprigera yunnana]|nr:hypothetical protein FQA39_LY02727 [Lamprigera yunnana]
MTMAWTALVLAATVFEYGTSMQIPMLSLNLDQNVLEGRAHSDLYGEYKSLDSMDDLKLERLKHYLVDILLHPEQTPPLVYIEEFHDTEGNNASIDEDYNQLPEVPKQIITNFNEMQFKRSRYYRKYPWKRQNSREAYDAENRYMCQPSKEDVFRLLVALHKARQGEGKTVNFCNRRRESTAVFSNIRFLGK